MNLVKEPNDIEGRVVRGPVDCDLCATNTKIGFRHGVLIVCIHCHFEVVEKVMMELGYSRN